MKLLKLGVIVRVDGPELWCAPAFFVPKGDGVSVRMVTDFTHISQATRIVNFKSEQIRAVV